MATTPFFFGTPKHSVVQIATADATAWKDLVVAGASGSKIVAVNAVSEDTVARVLVLSVLRGGVNYVLAAQSVAIGSGNDGVAPAADLLSTSLIPALAIDADGQKYLFLESGDKLQVKVTAAMTAAKIMHINADRGDG